MRQLAIAAFAIGVAAAAAAEPSPAELRMMDEPVFTVPGIDTDEDRVRAAGEQRCGSDWTCNMEVRNAYRFIKRDYLRADKAGRKRIAAALELATNDGATDWRRAHNSMMADGMAAAQRRRDAPLTTRCSTYVSKKGRHASTYCSSR